MNIAIADNNGGKFTADLVSHLEAKGHVVRFERGASEYLAQWADLYYFDTWDNNIHYIYKLYHGDPDNNLPADLKPIWDNNKKPKIVVRALDWEIWIGFVRDQRIVDWVDEVICIAPHMEKELRKHADFGEKLHLIRPGVNTEKFTLKEKETDGFQIGMALGDMWWPKNHMGGLDIFTSLFRKDRRWRLHIRGQHEGGNDYWKQMYEHYVESRNIAHAVTLYPHVEDMNQWYEGIDVLLHPGMKEAFCYSVGEAMAKGIRPVINNFYGSHDIWPLELLYNTHDDAIMKLNKPRQVGLNYRQYIESHYSLKEMMDSYDRLFKI